MKRELPKDVIVPPGGNPDRASRFLWMDGDPLPIMHPPGSPGNTGGVITPPIVAPDDDRPNVGGPVRTDRKPGRP